MLTTNSPKAIFVALLMLVATACAAPAVAQSWSQLEPLPRGLHSAVINLDSDRMIVFGGMDAGEDLGDVWLLTHPDGVGGLRNWRQLVTGNQVPARFGHTAVYDSASNRMVVFGGDTGNAYLGDAHCSNDVWVLTNADGHGGTSMWTKLAPTGSAPVRKFHTAVYDSANNRMIVFGGKECIDRFQSDDVWVLSYANGLGGTPAWTQLQVGRSSPAGRAEHTAIYSEQSNRMVVFGGIACDSIDCSYLNDVWTLSNANGVGTPTWTQLGRIGTQPGGRSEHTAVYDPTTNRMVVFGGRRIQTGSGLELFDDVWVLSHADGTGGTPTWTNSLVTGRGPWYATSHSAVYNPANDCMVAYGGLDMAFDGTHRNGLDDTYVLCNATKVAIGAKPNTRSH